MDNKITKCICEKANINIKTLPTTRQLNISVIAEGNENLQTGISAVLNSWIEYCSGLYTYPIHPHQSTSK
ncbi:hypothetical protein DPMN_114111 [Dreissena polymorpha]|uniref:Uncharacterized protein n=1 Tax=Dreissena polymorpha TaxID=45954 RepID=A0A9D4KJW6_DREPO|nr:hypothetical protein DPMN_114111 [Dreissena polymorpha]